MNLFDMIFRNSRSKEVVFSSVYNYLMDRYETHGLGTLMLERVIEALPDGAAKESLSQTNLEVQNTEAEFALGEVGQIDSMIELSTKDRSQTICLFTEVKIADTSARNVTQAGHQIRRYAEYIHTNISKDSVLIYLVPGADSAIALREFASFIAESSANVVDRCFVMYWRDFEKQVTSLPEKNLCTMSFETIVRQVLQDEMTGMIPPISTEMRYVLRSLINAVHSNFNRERTVYDHGRFPDRATFLGRLPETHRSLFEYLEEKSGSRRSPNVNNTSVGFPYTDNAQGDPNTLFRVLTMLNYRRTAEEILETDHAERLIIEINEKIWSLDDGMKDDLAGLFKGVAHVCFHQYHPNGKKNEPATWILFDENLSAADLPKAMQLIDQFWELAEERFRSFLESS